MTEPLVYLNGNFLPQSQVGLAINNAGFIWGATVTDLCRTFRHKLFRLDDHLRRFRLSCQAAKVPLLLTDEVLQAIAEDLVAGNAKLITTEQDLALVMFATPGEIGYYLGQAGGPGDGSPTLCLHTFPLPLQRYARFFREGARLQVAHAWHGWGLPVPASIKHRSRLHWWIADQEVRETDPHAQALLLDSSNNVTETATANILFVRDGKIHTPSRSRVLHGISLVVVEELCEELGIPFQEDDLKMTDWIFSHAQEVLLTSTPYCVVPVSSLHGRAVPWPGPVLEALLSAWSQKVGLDIRGQILAAA